MSTRQVTAAVRAAIAAPSLHNSQPWQFDFTPTAIRVWADPNRALTAADPDRRLMMLACGAALLNLRVAILAEGVNPKVYLLPDPAEPDLLAVVRPDGRYIPNAVDKRLATAVPHRHTNRRPFTAEQVPGPLVNAMRKAARTEGSWLSVLAPAQLPMIRRLLATTHRDPQNDPEFVREWNEWTGRGAADSDGVPLTSAGPLPEQQDMWVLRDFSAGTARPRIPGDDFESDPLLVVVETFNDLRVAQLQAGQAMQRVLLTATAEGLTASFLSQLVEAPGARLALRDLSGGRLWPQIVLRLGFGTPAPATPRRPLEEVLRTAAPATSGPVGPGTPYLLR
jgi:nitroreductase